jgi:hypothetical protein
VFPARIGPLGYAFVKFERLEDATRAFDALNNTVGSAVRHHLWHAFAAQLADVVT